MIQIKLTAADHAHLCRIKAQPASELTERALAVLSSHEDASAPQIAKNLKRHPHTIRSWLKRFQRDGVKGLLRDYSPGRPSTLRTSTEEKITAVIERSPSEFGYPVSLWSVLLLQDHLKKQGLCASEDTIERALKKRSYRYKRSGRSVPLYAPSKEAKQTAVAELVEKISKEIKQGDCEVFALDESHFSTEPYVVSGWQKKLWPPTNTDTKKARARLTVWLLEFPNSKILLEEYSLG